MVNGYFPTQYSKLVPFVFVIFILAMAISNTLLCVDDTKDGEFLEDGPSKKLFRDVIVWISIIFSILFILSICKVYYDTRYGFIQFILLVVLSCSVFGLNVKTIQ